MKNALEEFNSGLREAEKRIRELADRAVVLTQSEELKEKRMKKSEASLRDLSESVKWINIDYRGCRKRREREKGKKIYLKK